MILVFIFPERATNMYIKHISNGNSHLSLQTNIYIYSEQYIQVNTCVLDLCCDETVTRKNFTASSFEPTSTFSVSSPLQSV